jgi:hypothetical protein
VSASFDVAPLCEKGQAVDLGRTMDDLIERYLRPYLALDTHVAELFVLYGVGTHCLDIASHAPRLFLRSATPRCGKSTAIKVMAQFVRNAEIVSEVSRSGIEPVGALLQRGPDTSPPTPIVVRGGSLASVCDPPRALRCRPFRNDYSS